MHRGFRGNPVLLDRSVFHEVMALEGDIGCRAIFGSHLDRIVKVEVGDPGILLDIDDKNDYERLRHFDQSGQGERAPNEEPKLPLKEPGTEGQPARDELIVVGWEPVTFALVKLGRLLNFRVTVVDPLVRAAELPVGVTALNALDFSLLPDTPNRYIVVASRGRFDEEAIEEALRVECGYVGLLAGKKRGQELLRRLEHGRVQPEKLASLRVPAGLDIGAKTPEEIALSILAEIVSTREGKLRG
jgi:xanthine/CO dehydrogenase XdhC/CoxF family maturation factor